MFISHKSNVIQQINDVEWDCRRKTKGLTKPEYWEWIATITSGDPPVVDYSGETGYTIVECTDENVQERLTQLDNYVSRERVYNIKYYASKRDAEEIKDNEGNSHDPKQYVQSHFVGQDDTRDARLLAEQWKRIRSQRDYLLSQSDWVVIKAKETGGTISSAWKSYRQDLRDIPSQSAPDNITWPTKPA